MGYFFADDRRSSIRRLPLRHLHVGPRAGACHLIGDGTAKINLDGPDGRPELVFSIGIKKSDMRRLLAEIAEHRDVLLGRWEQIHGNPD